jgi:putative aldouronate transport system permease protein
MHSAKIETNLEQPFLPKITYRSRVVNDFRRNRWIYLMLLPVVVYYAVFQYGPMYGIQIAFKDYSPVKGMWNSPWVGFQYFSDFFHSFYFRRTLQNTLMLSVLDLIFTFPAPIVLALLLNEIRRAWFKRTVQTITYMPHFISIVVVVGMMVDFLASDGLVNQVLGYFGIGSVTFMQESGWFRPLYIGSGIWQQVGWGSIIYLAAISNIDPSLYEAAKVDGASRWKQTLNITIPGMIPIIVILFILKVGSTMVVGDEKILLMYSPPVYDTADVIGTYVFRKGIVDFNYSFSAAVGLFNSIINFTLLITANTISKRLSENKLW